jgi:hypothetical protein
MDVYPAGILLWTVFLRNAGGAISLMTIHNNVILIYPSLSGHQPRNYCLLSSASYIFLSRSAALLVTLTQALLAVP